MGNMNDVSTIEKQPVITPEDGVVSDLPATKVEIPTSEEVTQTETPSFSTPTVASAINEFSPVEEPISITPSYIPPIGFDPYLDTSVFGNDIAVRHIKGEIPLN